MVASKFWKVKVMTGNGPKWMWAKDFKKVGDKFSFKKCKSDGDEWFGAGSDIHVVMGSGADLIAIKPAEVNKTYGTLEVSK